MYESNKMPRYFYPAEWRALARREVRRQKEQQMEDHLAALAARRASGFDARGLRRAVGFDVRGLK